MAKKTGKKKINDNKKTNSEPIRKKLLLSKPIIKRSLMIIAFIVIISIIGFVWSTTLDSDVFTDVYTDDVTKAQLFIDYGNVQIKHAGESWSSAENGMNLYESDTVKTGDNTSASVILFESSVIRLDSNTEVTLQEIYQEVEETNVLIKQESGRTWNTVSKISGIDNYEVQTPTTVASVRGTAFVVIVQPNGTTYYGVAHGVLNVSSVTNDTVQGYIDINENESIVIFIDMVNKSLEVKPFDKDDWVIENLLKDEEFREDVKKELYERIGPYLPELKETYGITDKEFDVLIDGYLRGYYDLPPETPAHVRELFELS